ncbi:ATP-dependent DNA helicase [Pseudozyma hubeiensis SY62]|uniref:ATP-dependent DNA helicase n=1 Tax=Pseudozyma hubeiensis (strain SY62) TaxID=1305764 RepID=R9P624_PSEHS|nr:ATP-dependent DNA helicase [Pseudozyma hubeiensis SY62]GAC93565.1 ATP-dependent DNA helicase [Pseudozyma hubeiensis SY62]
MEGQFDVLRAGLWFVLRAYRPLEFRQQAIDPERVTRCLSVCLLAANVDRCRYNNGRRRAIVGRTFCVGRKQRHFYRIAVSRPPPVKIINATPSNRLFDAIRPLPA